MNCKHDTLFNYVGYSDTAQICVNCGTYWTSDGTEIQPTEWSLKYTIDSTNATGTRPEVKLTPKQKIKELTVKLGLYEGFTNRQATVEAWVKTFRGLKALKSNAQPKKSKLYLKGDLPMDIINKIADFVGFDLNKFKNIVYTDISEIEALEGVA